MADAPQDEAPAGLETKDAAVIIGGGRDSSIGHRSAPVPHTNRTGSGMLDGHDVHEAARTEGDGSGEQAAEAAPSETAPSEGPGITTESGGTQARSATGKATRAK